MKACALMFAGSYGHNMVVVVVHTVMGGRVIDTVIVRGDTYVQNCNSVTYHNVTYSSLQAIVTPSSLLSPRLFNVSE